MLSLLKRFVFILFLVEFEYTKLLSQNDYFHFQSIEIFHSHVERLQNRFLSFENFPIFKLLDCVHCFNSFSFWIYFIICSTAPFYFDNEICSF